MDQETHGFLSSQRVAVISIVQDDHTVHAATVHFAHTNTPESFYFLTEKASRKAQSLLSGSEVPASIVIGFSEDPCVTYQADGIMQLLKDTTELDAGWEAYGRKYSERTGARQSSEAILLKFTPSWSRLSGLDTEKRFTEHDE